MTLTLFDEEDTNQKREGRTHLEIGKYYRLWSDDIILADRIGEDYERERLAMCRMVERSPYSIHHHTLRMRVFGFEYPGYNEGDEMMYLADSGLYCGWEHRSFPLHVKEERKEVRRGVRDESNDLA